MQTHICVQHQIIGGGQRNKNAHARKNGRYDKVSTTNTHREENKWVGGLVVVYEVRP